MFHQRLPFRHPETAADVARLQTLLRDALTAIRFHPQGNLAVLNLASGRADETGALAAALTPARIGFYLGIDLRPDTIAEAARRWQLPGGSIEFRCGSASDIDRMRQIPEFDFIFIRHQNYWDDPVTWDRILANAISKLKPNGILATTSYFDHEHQLLKASLTTRGVELICDVRHPASRVLPEVYGKSVDRRLAILAKLGSPG
ncbi:MAG: class I SAM-dependent methyltransferase [Verrucomicrobiota bacterium]